MSVADGPGWLAAWDNGLVAKDFRYPDRDQSFLLPPDMRQWLPEGHLVWFMLEVLEGLDVSRFEARAKLGRAGRAAFAPRTLLGVLLYGYAHGQRSTRQLERLCEVDVAFKVLTGNEVPDHTTLARFRQRHEQALEDVFTQVLVMCSKAGLGRLGIVAIDGTKIAANAAKSSNATEQAMREKFRAEAARILKEAAEVDAAEDAQFGDSRGDELPDALRTPQGRQARIQQILAEIEAERQAQQQAASDAQQRNAEAYLQRLTDPRLRPEEHRKGGRPPAGVDLVVAAQARLDRQIALVEQRMQAYRDRSAKAAARGRKAPGRSPVPADKHSHVLREQANLQAARRQAASAAAGPAAACTSPPGKDIVRNLTDPDSRLMPTSKGFIQGYNCQLAVTDDQIILAVKAVQATGDVEQLVPMMVAAQAAAKLIAQHRPKPGKDDTIGTVVADAGYQSNDNLTAAGPDRLIALGKAHEQHQQARDEPAYGDPPPEATPRERMAHRLRTAEGSALYKRRGVTVEPVNGHLKDRIGLRTFSRRGLSAVDSELTLAATVANLMKIHRSRTASA